MFSILDDSEASVVKFVNQILREALEQRATDIHIEPLQDDLQIRYRIDGVLHEVPVPPNIKVLQASVISRLKIMAHLDIAERRLPQDGRINLELDAQAIDVRVATIPSVAGESISLRLLGRERFTFDRLGLDKASQTRIRHLLAMPNGIVLLTGPTGCGKSTTLYTFLSSLNTKERRIVTVEDPVEYKLPGVIQIAVKPEIDLTFANGLRSILRGDPNVIMVGEMRDRETAEIAIRGALTGHLVFSTLHTNDAIGGITRLVDMGIEPFLVANAVRAFIAQRLVRVLCSKCKRPVEHAKSYLKQIGFPLEHARKAMAAVGCEHCRHTGYEGRAAIFEFCLVSQRLQDLITQGRPPSAMRAAAIEEGMIPLRPYGWNKVIGGVTTVEEVVRVTASDLRNVGRVIGMAAVFLQCRESRRRVASQAKSRRRAARRLSASWTATACNLSLWCSRMARKRTAARPRSSDEPVATRNIRLSGSQIILVYRRDERSSGCRACSWSRRSGSWKAGMNSPASKPWPLPCASRCGKEAAFPMRFGWFLLRSEIFFATWSPQAS